MIYWIPFLISQWRFPMEIRFEEDYLHQRRSSAEAQSPAVGNSREHECWTKPKNFTPPKMVISSNNSYQVINYQSYLFINYQNYRFDFFYFKIIFLRKMNVNSLQRRRSNGFDFWTTKNCNWGNNNHNFVLKLRHCMFWPNAWIG